MLVGRERPWQPLPKLSKERDRERGEKERDGRRGSCGPYNGVYQRRSGCGELIGHGCRLGAGSSRGHGPWDSRKVINLVTDTRHALYEKREFCSLMSLVGFCYDMERGKKKRCFGRIKPRGCFCSIWLYQLVFGNLV